MTASAAPFFIVGSGRSGSTLLRLMLTSHSRIAIPYETWYLAPLLKQFPLDRPLQENEITAAAALMTSHFTWCDLGLDAGEFRCRVARVSAVRSGAVRLRDLAEIVYRWHMELEGKSRWGDKTPPYIEIVPALAALFDNAKFIHLIRDGRDVAKSFQKHDWDGPGIYGYTREWFRAAECDLELSKTDLNERILRVRYEDLVLNPEATLRGICAFIDERFESGMLLWRGNIARAVPDRYQRFHASLGRDMEPSDVGRWTREMTPLEIYAAEALIGKQLSRFGYELRYRSKMWSPLFAATRLYCATAWSLLRLKRRASGLLRRGLLRSVELLRLRTCRPRKN